MRVSSLLSGSSLLALSSLAQARLTSFGDNHHAELAKRSKVYDTICPDGQYRYTNKCFPCSDPNALKCRARGTIALSCKTGSALKGGSCVVECGRRYRVDTTGLCVRCSDANAVTCTATAALSCSDKFLLDGACVTQSACPIDTYPDWRTRTCRSCSLIDTDAASCTQRGPVTCATKFLKGQSCVDDCGAGFYQDEETRVCLPCSDPKATTCNKDATLTCSSGFLSGSVCVEECPAKTFVNEGVCSPCNDPNALACSDAATATSCGADDENEAYFLDTTTSTCVLGRNCPTGYFSQTQDHKCASCKTGAQSCDDDGETTTCSEGLFFSVGDCIAECLANTRVVEGSCIECGEGIATCDSEGTPLTCGTGPDGAQRFLTPSGTCASECPPRSFADLSTLACQDCPSGALTCASAEEALTCGPFDEAVTFLSADGKCVRNCALGTYPDEESSTCKACTAGAAQCDGKGVTTECAQGLYLTPSADCVTRDECPASTFPSQPTQRKRLRRRAPSVVAISVAACIPCGESALTCFSTTRASSCGSNKAGDQTYLLNGHCVLPATCPDWSFADSTINVCKRCSAIAPGSETCDAKGALTCGVNENNAQLYVTPNQNCVLRASECPSNTYADDEKFACTSCDDGVTTCNGSGAGTALSCGRTTDGVSLFLDSSNSCVAATECPTATWANEATSTCTACDDGEAKCTGNGEGSAISCGTNKDGEKTFLNPSKECVVANQCPAAYFADGASSTCVQCDEGEASCISAGRGGATSCAKSASGAQLFLDSFAECVTAKDCPVSTFPDKSDNTCAPCADGALICTSKTDASLCGTNSARRATYLDDGACVLREECSSGTWPDDELAVCRECSLIDKDAETCTPSSALTWRLPGFLPSNHLRRHCLSTMCGVLHPPPERASVFRNTSDRVQSRLPPHRSRLQGPHYQRSLGSSLVRRRIPAKRIAYTSTAAICTINCNRMGYRMMNWQQQNGGECDCWLLPSVSSPFHLNANGPWQVGGFGRCASFNRQADVPGQCWESNVDVDDGYCVRIDNGQPCS